MTVIRTPDYRLRVFISGAMPELLEERLAIAAAVRRLRLTPVLVEAGARPHPPRELYRAYLDQSHIFVGAYGETYGWVPPGEDASAVEDEYHLSGDRPKLIYVRVSAPDRDPRLAALLDAIAADATASYRHYTSPDELEQLVVDDLALLLTERYEHARLAAELPRQEAAPEPAPRRVPAPSPTPVPPTPLVGRREEIQALGALLRRDDVRLVTVTGPGGIGKTRLALAVAGVVAEEFPDGVFWVDTSPIRDPTFVESRIVHALDLRETVGRRPLETLVEHLRERRALLVVDSFERVVAAGPQLAALLAQCPALKLLVTSRARLRVRGEHDFTLAPLPITEANDERLEIGDAVRLFVERAQAADPTFELTDDNLDDVVQICARLDGLPLAIELAAARVRLLAPAALLHRLDRRLQLLTGGPRDMPERQRAMRAALDWDYELLDEDERAVYRRLSVCPSGCDLETAEALVAAGGGRSVDVLSAVDSLVGKSLLRQAVEDDGDVRVTMLETVREYGQERVEAAGEAEAVRVAHARLFMQFAESCASLMRTHEQVAALGRLEREHDNLRLALRTAAENGDTDTELRLCAALSMFWHTHGHLREAGARLDAALSRSVGMRTHSRAEVLTGATFMDRARTDYVSARAHAEEAAEIYQLLGDARGGATALRLIGLVAYEQGDMESAMATWRECLETVTALGDDLGMALVLNNLGLASRALGHYDEARGYLARCLNGMTTAGDQVGVARALMNIANVARDLGEPALALGLCRRSARVWLLLGDAWDMTDALENAGAAGLVLDQPALAARLYGASSAIRDALGAAIAEAEMPEHNRHMAALREALGDDAFDVEWAAGRELPAAAAVDLVAELADRAGVGEADVDRWLAGTHVSALP
jgi:predicted ATPase